MERIVLVPLDTVRNLVRIKDVINTDIIAPTRKSTTETNKSNQLSMSLYWSDSEGKHPKPKENGKIMLLQNNYLGY